MAEEATKDCTRRIGGYPNRRMAAKEKPQIKPDEPPLAEMRQMNVEIRKDIVLKAKTHCLYAGMSLSQFVERAITKALLSKEST